MTYSVIIRQAAEDDLDEASAWYEKKQSGLGKRFLAAEDETIEKICNWPDSGILVHKPCDAPIFAVFPTAFFMSFEKSESSL